MNVDSNVNISNGHVNAVVSSGNTSVSADVDVNNRNVQSEVQRRNNSVVAQTQVRSGNVNTEINPHISVVNDHSQLHNLGYEESGHIGFQRQLDSDNAGDGISITTDPNTGKIIISNTQSGAVWGNITGTITDQNDLVEFIKSEHRAYYNNYTMYEGVAPYGSLDTDAVWTVTIIQQNSDGEVTQVETLYNQIWNNYIN